MGDLVFSGSAWGAVGQVAPAYSLGEPSRIFVHDLDSGDLVATILVEGEDTSRDHGLLGLKTDGPGRLYAASGQLGILRFSQTPEGWTQEIYAAIPDLPSCQASGPPCSRTLVDRAPMPNDMTWDSEGNLYVSDSWQATIWRVPTGGTLEERVAQVWYQHGSLDRAFGPNGLRIGPEGDRMFLAICCPDTFAVGPVDRASRIVTVPFPQPGEAAPTDFYVLGVAGEGADGMHFSASGDLYLVSVIGNKLLIVGPDGALKRSVVSEDLSGEGVFDGPASVVFLDEVRSLLVANYAYLSVLQEHRYVLEVFVDDTGFPEALPVVP